MILTLSTYLYSFQPLLKQNNDNNQILVPLPDSKFYGRKLKKIYNCLLSQGQSVHFKLFKIALLCYFNKGNSFFGLKP